MLDAFEDQHTVISLNQLSRELDISPAVLDSMIDYWVHKGRRRHILGNLLSNAIKYSPEENPVTFTVDCGPDQIVFRVQDQGIGIPEKDQQHLFEAFHRASRGSGPRLPFLFPTYHQQRQGRNMKTILVIDDDQMLRSNVLELLELEGYEALGAENGRDGILLAREHKPDLIISDVRMPVLDGFGVITDLRQDLQMADIPVILLSAQKDPTVADHGLQLGAVAYLFKPYNHTELLSTIRA